MNEQEDDPKLLLNFEGGGEVICTRENTTLFTFLGNLSSRNHVFIQTEPTDLETRVAKGTYIFQAAEVFGQLAAWLWDHDFPMHLNSTEVPTCDEVAYQTYIENNIAAEEDFTYLPDGWE